MFSNLRKGSGPEASGFDGGPGGRHSSALRELGALLRERREAMGVSLAEVEVATRIRQKYLSALESDEWHLLPGEVVGRGFLRNYADYLGLEPNEAIDRRRAVSDTALAPTLANTSAGSSLPPIREVDYRPKEVDLKDEGDGIQRGEVRLTPIFAIVGVALLVVGVWWGISAMAGPMGSFFADIPDRLAGATEQATPVPAAPTDTAGVVNPENVTLGEAAQLAAAANVSPENAEAQAAQSSAEGNAALPSAPQAEAQDPAPESISGTGGPVDTGAVLVPTSTPEQPAPPAAEPAPQVVEPAPPAPQPEPPPQPVQAPEAEAPVVVILPSPTPEPVVEQAPVQAPACGDSRALINGPGVNQVVAGVVAVTGVATHDVFQYFKLEYAPGANAGGGFVYFAGSNAPVSGGVLGNLDSRALPNGDYTIRLTVVDQTSNYPPPCDVSIVIQN